MLKTDILIIGSGLAGAIAAVSAADQGKKVTILTKTADLMSGNTPHAQGGIIYKGLSDSPKKLKEDIVTAGGGHCWDDAVDTLCHNGPKLVEQLLLKRFNVCFDKHEEELHRTLEGAHSEPRIVHVKDHTGENIQNAVIEEIENNPNITHQTKYMVVDLITLCSHSKNSLDVYKEPTCIGAYVLNIETGEVFPFLSHKTILATGGLGQIYLHTSNPEESTGDGISLAWRAGARCMNMQFIQFHPTTFYGQNGRFLISEAMRGEGAHLLDVNGSNFIKKAHKLGSLAPRNVVVKAIHQSMTATNHPCVYLDISHKDSQWIRERFPSIYKHCISEGVDICKQLIPVVPAAHYSCGGIGVNLNGETTVNRLYAVGEVSCTGLHGNNRLASTSLLEAVVWGNAAGLNAAKTCSEDDYFPQIFEWEQDDQEVDEALISQSWLILKNTMWNYVGLNRTSQRLARAFKTLQNLQLEIGDLMRTSAPTQNLLELRNAIQTAILVTNDAYESNYSKNLQSVACMS